MLNRSASPAMSTSVLKALPGKLDIKRHSPSIPYLPIMFLLSRGCQCSVSLPCGPLDWSVVCDRGISWSYPSGGYSHFFLDMYA